jgi:hypothetical protein
MSIGDSIIVTWTGAANTPPGGSHTAPPKIVQTVAPQEIALDNKVVAFNLGKTTTVTYTVSRGGSPVTSPALNLQVKSLPQSALAKPTITQAANNGDGAELDVAGLTVDGTARMGGWPLIAVGQPVWLALSGINTDDSPYRKELWKVPDKTDATWLSQGFSTVAIPLAELRNLKHGSALSLQFKAGLGGSQVESEAVSFPVRSYTVVTQPLAVDSELMQLDGLKYIQDYGWATKEVPANVRTRLANGGTGSYRYVSGNPLIASVTQGGKVSGLKNGRAIITITDSSQTTVSYEVVVSNVYRIITNNSMLTASQIQAWGRSVGGAEFHGGNFVIQGVSANFQDVRVILDGGVNVLKIIPNFIAAGSVRALITVWSIGGPDQLKYQARRLDEVPGTYKAFTFILT